MLEILRLIIVLILGAAILAAVVTFGLFVLIALLCALPFLYIYARFKHPELFKALKEAKERTKNGAYQGQNGYQTGGSSAQENFAHSDNVIEGDYQRLDEEDDHNKDRKN